MTTVNGKSVRRRTLRNSIAVCGLMVIIGLLVMHWIVMPRIVRQRVDSALRQASIENSKFRVTRATLWGAELQDVRIGQTRIERVELKYSPVSFWKRPLDSLRLSNVQLVLNEGDGLSSAAHRFAPALNITFAGDWRVDGIARWGDQVTSIDVTARSTMPGAALTQSPATQLELISGVIHVAGDVGPKALAPLRIEATGADLRFSGNLSARDVQGAIVLTSLSPIASAQPQRLSASKLTLGKMELSDGFVDFLLRPDGIVVEQTRWNWLGGELSTGGVTIKKREATTAMVQLTNVELQSLLDTLAGDRASGEGRISGNLPITIDGPRVSFGAGTLAAASGGTLRIRDIEALLPATGQASQSSSGKVAQNVAEALGDFEFHELRGELAQEPGGLVARVHMLGQGRRGSRQMIEYDLNITGLDDLLTSYMNLRGWINRAERHP